MIIYKRIQVKKNILKKPLKREDAKELLFLGIYYEKVI